MHLDKDAAKTLAERIEDRIETEIVEGRLRPGDRLDEEELATRLSVSRTPIREALRKLASTGLVTIRPRLGASVARPTMAEIIELFELVAELEAFAARLACERADPAQLEEIAMTHAACQKLADAGTAETYFEANRKFHGAIWQGSNNRALVEQLLQIDRRLSPYRRHITFHPGRRHGSQSEHQKIADALVSRDTQSAAAEMRDHVMILSDDALQLARNLRL